MKTKHPTRPARPSSRGRPKKLRTPPRSIGDAAVILELFSDGDLISLAETVGLEIREAYLVDVVSIVINQAFSEFASATSIQINNSPASERRDWCAGVSTAAAELRRALGCVGESLFHEKPSFEAEQTLAPGRPTDPQTAENFLLRQQVTTAYSFAMPDKYALSRGERSAQEIDGDLQSLLGRLGPALHALAMVARSAETVWTAKLSQSRSSREDARRHLMTMLVVSFGSLFGRAPLTTPAGADYRWFSTLITQAGQTAREQRGAHPPGGARETEERISALEAVERIADQITPQPIQTKGTAKLSHWLRDALADPDVQRARAKSEAALSKPR